MPNKTPTTPSLILQNLRTRGEAVAANTLAHADSKEGCSADCYDAIFAMKAPPHEAFLASAIEPRARGASAAGQGLVKRLKSNSAERVYSVFLTPPNLIASPDHLNIDVRELRKLKGAYKKCGIVNAIGVTTVLNRPSASSMGFEAYAAHGAILFGPELDEDKLASLERLLNTRYFSNNALPAMSYDLVSSDPARVFEACARLFELSDRKANSKATSKVAKELGVSKWKKSRPLRDFLRTQAFASVPFKSLVVAHGDGERLADSALNEGKHALKRLAKDSDQVLHRDQIAQFSASELVRLEMETVKLPFLRTR